MVEEEDLLKQLKDIEETAFKNAVPDISSLKSIKALLFTVSKDKRDFLKPFVNNLKEKLFNKNTSIPGLDLQSYFKDDDKTEELKKSKSIQVEIEKEIEEITFDELLKKLLECIQETITDLKGYAILKLSNHSNDDKWKIKILHDENYYVDPITNKVNKTFSECDSSSISDFSNDIADGYSTDKNLLCLVLLTSKIHNKDAREVTKINLKLILDSFDEFEYCTIKEFGKYDGEFYKRKVEKDDFFEEINYVTSKFLSNGKVSFEEEKIIKKVFEDSSTPVLSYRLLKSGNSGSKVVEIKPVKAITSGQYERRFIVKYTKIDEDRKLKQESNNFNEFIEAYEGNNEYKCTRFVTSTYEALKYDFAKSPGTIESYSYAEILEEKDNPFYSNPAVLIKELFSLEIFKLWQSESISNHKASLKTIYNNYVNLNKIEEQVLVINNITQSEFNATDFKLNLDKLLKNEIEVKRKICHGDLHSENFFKDDKGNIFLIDFGFTGIEHALIDYTSLECSIKFNHIPRYLDISNLLRVEEELLLDDSFNNSYVFKEASNRQDLLKYCEIIREIRKESESYLMDINNKTEYFISLFFMTYRQVRYPNMNQLYAYRSAEILLNKIIRDLGL